MKPLKVTMQAFGPYIEKCTVDFDKLNKNRIFLITGPTGSGKTTILDAMCFALYGMATGENRQWDLMRNTAAQDNIATYVQFEFSIGNDIYKFERSRSYKIRKRKSDKPQELETTVYAYKKIEGEWEKIASTGKAATALATELLGFNRDQFVQVIILPQGEFKKLLVAKSTEKSEILETLFSASRWKMIASNAANQCSKLSEELNSISAMRETLLKNHNTENFQQLYDLKNNISLNLKELSTQSIELNNKLNKANTELQDAKSVIKNIENLEILKQKYEKSKNELESIADKKQIVTNGRKILSVLPYYSTKNSVYNDLNNNKKKIDKLTLHISSLKQNLNKAKILADDIPNKRKQINENIIAQEKLKQSISDANLLFNLFKSSKKLNNDLIILQDNIKNLNRELENNQTKLSEGEKTWNDIQKNYILNIPQFEAKINFLKSAQIDYKVLDEQTKYYDNICNKYSQYKTKTSQSLLIANQKKVIADKAEQLMLADWAYRLSINLNDGKPCPVCGSIEHPFPAQPHDGQAIDKEKYLQLRQEADNAIKISHENTLKLESLQTEINSAKVLMDTAKKNCDIRDIAKDDIEPELKKYQEQLNFARKKESQIDLVEAKRLKLIDEIETLKKNITQANNQELNLKAQLLSNNNQIERLKTTIGDNNHDIVTLEKSLQNLINETEQLTSWCDLTEKNFSALKEQYQNVLSEIEFNTNLNKELTEKYNTALNTYLKQCQALGIANENDIINFNLTEKSISEMEKDISEKEDTYKTDAKIYKEQNKLYGNIAKPDILAIQKNYDDIMQQRSQCDMQYGTIKRQLESLDQTIITLSSIEQKQVVLDKQYGKMKQLSNFLSGKNQFNTPIHQFVLGIMLEEIIISANQYLLRFSRGQYSLLRVDREKSGKGYMGMELDVIDAHRGGRRDVKTLSGGEIFLASLSLAFGLSDVVQRFAGGIHLDSIFIDEGFGSLDSETLETAMRALNDIQSSGRVVGIISHVSELKNRIAARIEINTDINGGSHISVKDI